MRLWIQLPVVIALIGCGPRVPVDTDADADTDTDMDTDTDSDTDTDTEVDKCPEAPDAGFYGQLEAGQVTATSPYKDSGISAVVAAQADVVDGTPKAVDIQVTDAVVASIGYTPSSATAHWSVWVADSKGAVRTYLKDSTGTIPSTVKPGDTISFKVKQLTNFAGEFQISQITDFALGADTSLIWLQETNGTTLSYADHGRELVHAYGQVVTDPAACGSYECMDLDLDGQTVDFRIKPEKGVVKGDCLDVVAPVGVFNGGVQFNIDNFDWVDFY